jgi:hypothetical protein
VAGDDSIQKILVWSGQWNLLKDTAYIASSKNSRLAKNFVHGNTRTKCSTSSTVYIIKDQTNYGINLKHTPLIFALDGHCNPTKRPNLWRGSAKNIETMGDRAPKNMRVTQTTTFRRSSKSIQTFSNQSLRHTRSTEYHMYDCFCLSALHCTTRKHNRTLLFILVSDLDREIMWFW